MLHELIVQMRQDVHSQIHRMMMSNNNRWTSVDWQFSTQSFCDLLAKKFRGVPKSVIVIDNE